MTKPCSPKTKAKAKVSEGGVGRDGVVTGGCPTCEGSGEAAVLGYWPVTS